MVAIAYTDLNTPAAQPTHAPAAKRPARQPANSASDPVVEMATRLLSAPLHQAYAWLWRAGLLSVDH